MDRAGAGGPRAVDHARGQPLIPPARLAPLALLALLVARCGPAAQPPGGAVDGGDAGQPDAGAAHPPFTWPSADAGPPCAPVPSATSISQVCLYEDVATGRLRHDVVEYTPAHQLWSDGAAKRRWIRLPPGAAIDTSNMDGWQFPVGTALFKEFTRDGGLLETRMIRRTGAGTNDYELTAFVWNAAGTDATAAGGRVDDVNGTAHDVPSPQQCQECHRGEAGRVLGFSAVQLSGPGPGPRLVHLAEARLLSDPPAGGAEFPVPGDAAEVAALGYLHANCGPCHNPSGMAYWLVNLELRLPAAALSPRLTPTYLTTVGQRTRALFGTLAPTRVVKGSPSQSDLYLRMGTRGSSSQMPPWVSEAVDVEARAAIARWIEGL